MQTELGQGLADAIGYKEPPLTPEQSAKGVVEQVGSALIVRCFLTDERLPCRLTG